MLEDAPGVAEVIAACELADSEMVEISVEEVRADWTEIDMERDARVAVAPDGRIVGHVYLNERAFAIFDVDGYVHPDHNGHGIGTRFLRLAEVWARERAAAIPADVRVVLRHGIDPRNTAALQLFAQEDYVLIRNYYRMAIDFDAEPAVPEWPAPLGVRTFVPDQDERATFDALDEGFRDMWQYRSGRFERFLLRTEKPNFDPGLWFLAIDGDEIAGVALCETQVEKGYVASLAVRRPWRGRGVGIALLQETFGAFYRRGERRVELSVDSENPTGATRLYLRAGMYPAFTIALYEKELRPGRQPDEEAT